MIWIWAVEEQAPRVDSKDYYLVHQWTVTDMQRHSFTALNSLFVVQPEYVYVKELGQGAYGCVVAAKHQSSGEGCAIKKITNINTKVWSRMLAAAQSPDVFCSVYLPKDVCEKSGKIWYYRSFPE